MVPTNRSMRTVNLQVCTIGSGDVFTSSALQRQ